MLNDDGDIIRGLGFLTLYAAYLEEAIDELANRIRDVTQPVMGGAMFSARRAFLNTAATQITGINPSRTP